MDGIRRILRAIWLAVTLALCAAVVLVASPASGEGKGHGKPDRSETATPDRSGPRDDTVQGRSSSKPDQDGIGADHGEFNGDDDKTGPDADGNNGCGNDADREDDNNGWCGKPPFAGPPEKEERAVVQPRAIRREAAVAGKVVAAAQAEVAGKVVTKPQAEQDVAAERAKAPEAEVMGIVLSRTGVAFAGLVPLGAAALALGAAIRRRTRF